MKVEKIALVFFPINDVGGIITWNKEIQRGLNRLGVETVLLYATAGNTYNCDPENDVLKERYTQLAGYHLSFNNANVKRSIEILNSFDAVIFTKSSPHPTKDNLAKKDINNWRLLYSEVTVPKVVVFHDAMWQKTNPWCAEVAEYVDVCIAAQKKFLHSVNAYPAKCLKYWDYFPMDFEPIDKLNLTKESPNFGMVATQWVKWKNHHKLLPMLPKIKMPLRIFGAGMEWHFLKKTPEYLNGIREDWKMTDPDIIEDEDIVVHNHNSIHNVMGQLTYEDLQSQYAKAVLSIDLSTRGYTNYTHFEPLAYRTLSLLEMGVANDPDNIIPDDCCVTYEMYQLPDIINMIHRNVQGFKIHPSIARTRENGQKFIRQFDCVKVAARLIESIENL